MVQDMISDYVLYANSPGIHAAVHKMADIAEHYRASDGDRHKLFEDLIQFFGKYDRMRTDEVELLKAHLTEALKWSAKPQPLCTDSPDGNHHAAPIGSDEEWMPSKAPCYYCGEKQTS